MSVAPTRAAFALAALAAVAPACDKPTDDNLDKWMHTEKGPAKLKKALADEGLDPAISAHAAANLIKRGMDGDVRATFDAMSPPRRAAVMGLLAPRLWNVARVDGEMLMPAPINVVAKDMLAGLRKYADDAGKAQIDGYLVDWYGVASYEGRAAVGSQLGPAVIRTVGEKSAKKLMAVADGVIAAPGQAKAKNKVGDQLLLGLAATGSPAAVKYVLDVARMDRGDDTLGKRALSALYKAYVDPQGELEAAPPEALVPNIEALAAIAKDDRVPGEEANDALSLIRQAGPPACLAPLVALIPMPHANSRYKYAVVGKALQCGGVKAIKDVVRAMPDVAYTRDDLIGAVATVVANLSPRDAVLGEVRSLLDDARPVVRWVAIETLAAMKSKDDAARIAGVRGSEKLVGYWGDQSDLPAADRKPEPTLAQRGKELAAALK